MNTFLFITIVVGTICFLWSMFLSADRNGKRIGKYPFTHYLVSARCRICGNGSSPIAVQLGETPEKTLSLTSCENCGVLNAYRYKGSSQQRVSSLYEEDKKVYNI